MHDANYLTNKQEKSYFAVHMRKGQIGCIEIKLNKLVFPYPNDTANQIQNCSVQW